MPGPAQPNILVVMCDQLVAGLTGAYGHRVVKTPHLDRMAAAGVRFDAAYTASPLCAPARASMMTGRWSSELGVYDNAAPFPSDVPTFAHYLTNAGYDTVLSGKMHFVGADQLHGFRTRLTTDIYPADLSWTTRRDGPHVHRRPTSQPLLAQTYTTAGVRTWSKGLAFDEETHFRALEYLRSREGHKQPFCLCVSYHHPHDPFHVTQQMWDSYEDAEIEIPVLPDNLDDTYSTMDRWLNLWHGVDELDAEMRDPETMRSLRRSYLALVSYIDQKLGELVETLERYGLRENTVIVFLSDHGDMLGEKRMIQKRCFYEWSCRIPLVVEGPDRFEGGRVVSSPVSLVDLHATLCELGGVTDLEPHEGTSLVPLLRGDSRPDRIVLSELHADGIYATCFMARGPRYKLIYVNGHDRQLFDLDTDPGEWTNLAGRPEYAAVESELEAAILSAFDPDGIERKIGPSIAARKLVDEAMRRNATYWDYEPRFDPTSLYVRSRPGRSSG